MSESAANPQSRPQTLRLVLIAAVLQGWGLYGLSWSVDHHAALAKNSGLLMALYAFFTVAPLTFQFLIEHGSRRLTAYLALGTGLLFAGLGWHFGYNISNQPGVGFFEHNESFQHIVAGIALWLLILPLLQSHLVNGRWVPVYANFFAQKWRNLLTLIEATLFTAIFWGLLYLCDALFRMLGVPFFGELFRKEIFSIPVTWLTFGVALFLIGGLDQLTTLALRQILSILKWLAVPALFIVGFFTLALGLSIPGLVGSGHRAINATTLLWIVALTVLLLNAAYRDGETEQPYPRAIGVMLRVLVPLTLVIALVAAWSLLIRTRAYGLTVARSWGWLVTLAAITFTAGYSICATHKDRWMRGMNRVNIAVAVGLIAAITLAMTPLFSPYRLAANSQTRVILAGQKTKWPTPVEWRNNLLNALRFDAGEYGKEKLRALSADSRVPKELRDKATEMLAANYTRYGSSPVDARQALALVKIYPQGRTLPPDLTAVVGNVERAQIFAQNGNGPFGVFVDLTGDGVEEFVLLRGNYGEVFGHVDDQWRHTADLSDYSGCPFTGLQADLDADRYTTRPAEFAELTIGSAILVARPTLPCRK